MPFDAMPPLPVFRRKIEIAVRYPDHGGEVRAALEDDFHHFRVALHFNRGHVTQVNASAPRTPYTTCPTAAGQLALLAGMPLASYCNSVMRVADASCQCTHMFDLAGLAVAAAAQKIAHRVYCIEVPRHINGRTHARLTRDQEFQLIWEMQQTVVTGPTPYTGLDLRASIARWAISALEPETVEAALVLRRCALIALGRLKNLDRPHSATPTGHCFVQQPERAALALRVIGSTWDFTQRAADLCNDDRRWLAFETDAHIA